MKTSDTEENDCWPAIARHIGEIRGELFQAVERHAVGGGCINGTWHIAGCGQRYFVKLNTPDKLEMFEAEADGLRELALPGCLRVPAPLCSGIAGQHSYLVLEYLNLAGPTALSWEALGRGLAAQHRHTQPRFGWGRDNTLGACRTFPADMG